MIIYIFKIGIGLRFLIYKSRLSVIEYRDCYTANRIGVIFVVLQMPLPHFLGLISAVGRLDSS
jgi:hypothetical protein